MDKFDVLKRAKEILEKGPLPEDHSEHGEYCPYCAIGLAKSQLDEEGGTGLSTSDCHRQLMSGGFTEVEEDLPLVGARVAIGTLPMPFTKDISIAAINIAIKYPERKVVTFKENPKKYVPVEAERIIQDMIKSG